MERGEGDPQLFRLLTALVKLTTAKQAVSGLSEVLECFGGAGYVEDTGLPQLLRDAQVLPIWEGTTNVLALDALQTLSRSGFEPLRSAMEDRLGSLQDQQFSAAASATRAAFEQAVRSSSELGDDAQRQRSARHLALRLSHYYADALLLEHAQWCLDHNTDTTAVAAAHCLVLDEQGPGSCDPDHLKLLATGG